VSKLLIACLIVLTATLLALSTAQAQDSTLTFKVDKKADLMVEGRAADLTLTVACPYGWQILEAFVYLLVLNPRTRETLSISPGVHLKLK
jgi:hypothetical protein